MQTIGEARRLVQQSHTDDGTRELLARLGFSAPLRELDSAAREQLDLPATVAEARVARGEGALRALVLNFQTGADLRSDLGQVARELTARVPQLLWIVLATHNGGDAFSVSAWRSSPRQPRLCALMTERSRVLDSDAETLCALFASAEPTGSRAGNTRSNARGDGPADTEGASGDVLRHLRWTDVLGRQAITRRFYRALQQVVTGLSLSLGGHVPAAAARDMALLVVSRLLFLAFLETRGWLNSDFGFLANGFADCMATGGGYHRRVLEPLFFGTLNTRVSDRAARARSFGQVPFLNGGLFARTPNERRWRGHTFTDDALGAVFGDLLVGYRFTAREWTGEWSESAIDPEILGKAFESLMAAEDRRSGGVFYTPQAYVERLTRLALVSALARDKTTTTDVEQALNGHAPDPAARAALLGRLANLRILDPACGSGAFLVHAMEQLASLHRVLGDCRPIATIRRSVLTRGMYGVDINPTAVWLCELRLWLSSVIDTDERDPMRVTPLPNLDRQIRVGDSLAGMLDSERANVIASHRAARLRMRYSRATGRRKTTLARVLDRAERERSVEQLDRALTRVSAERRELLCGARERDLFCNGTGLTTQTRRRASELRLSLRSLRARRAQLRDGGALPFSYSVHFPEAATAGGFDVILGNPPWIRTHNITAAARRSYRERFCTFRNAAWREGASAAGAGNGFGGQADSAALFVERSCDLSREGGTVALLLPAKLWCSLAGGGVRGFVRDRMQLVALEDYGAASRAFDAAVYPSVIVATRRAAQPAHNAAISPSERTGCPPMSALVQRGATATRWQIRPSELSLDTSTGSPWLLVPPDVRSAFDRVRSAGVAMTQTSFGRPLLGVKTGCNAAFVVQEISSCNGVAHVRCGAATGWLESQLLRPLVRGEGAQQWTVASGDQKIIWTHGPRGAPLTDLPQHVAAWLGGWRRSLEKRSDGHARGRWWSLFRIESADARSARVVWNDFGRRLNAAVLLPGDATVPLNSCYVARCSDVIDAYALAALLNSPTVTAWLSLIAEPARGGYRRFLGWTVGMLPIPADWARARDLLAPLAERAIAGTTPSPCELDDAVTRAYSISPGSSSALLEWHSAHAAGHG